MPASRHQSQPLYEIKEAFEKFGAEGLAPQAKPKPNQTPPELEAQILKMTGRYPTYSYLRISDQLKLVGVGVWPSTVRRSGSATAGRFRAERCERARNPCRLSIRSGAENRR